MSDEEREKIKAWVDNWKRTGEVLEPLVELKEEPGILEKLRALMRKREVL